MMPLPTTVSGDLGTLDLVALATDLGVLRATPREGLVWIECPWEHEHSCFTGDGETALLAPTEGGRWPLFRCLHEHCEHRRFQDFVDEIEEHEPGVIDRHCQRSWRGTGGRSGGERRQAVREIWPPPI
jgi:hypothetical protein